MLRVHSIPFSANVERVLLAAGLKGLEVELIDHPYGDRSAVVEVSGQSFVPVVEHEGAVVTDSPAILRWMDTIAPEPRLWPDDDPVLLARTEITVEWFNGVWKGPPNELEGLWRLGDRTSPRAVELAARLSGWTSWFDDLLSHGEDWLLGDRLTAADVVVAPFLEYARWPEGSLPYLFEEVLQELVDVEAFPRIVAWLDRVKELPRA